MCLDEGDVPLSQAADFEACLPYRISDDTLACKPPVVKKGGVAGHSDSDVPCSRE